MGTVNEAAANQGTTATMGEALTGGQLYRPTLFGQINSGTVTLDTMTLIVEAIYVKHRVRLLDRVNLLLEQQRVLFRIACDRRYMSKRQHEYIANALDEAGRMVGGWRKKSRAKSRASV